MMCTSAIKTFLYFNVFTVVTIYEKVLVTFRLGICIFQSRLTFLKNYFNTNIPLFLTKHMFKGWAVYQLLEQTYIAIE